MAAPRVFILPKGKEEDIDSVSHTILTFKHPNTGVPTRYLVHHPSSSSSDDTPAPFLYEILKVANPVHAPRSWLITPDVPPLEVPTSTSEESEEKEAEESKEVEDGTDETAPSSLIIKDAHLFLTTPFDPLYIFLTHLSSPKTSRNFHSFDDILDSHPESSTWNKILTLHPPSSKLLQARLLSICDTVDAGDEVMYRLNIEKLYALLISRVEAVAKSLPPSLKNHIERKLSKPIGVQASTSWKRQSEMQKADDATGGIINDAEIEDEDEEAPDAPPDAAAETQLRREASKLNINESESATDTPMETETTAEIVSESLLPPPEIQYLCSLSHSIQFLQTYLPPEIYTTLSSKLNELHPPEPLEKYMEELKTLRQAANSALDFSMSHAKRTIEDLEGGVSKEEAEREKKRKKKEEDSKKSSAVKKLEKVDTKGMMKMTAFFKKKETK